MYSMIFGIATALFLVQTHEITASELADKVELALQSRSILVFEADLKRSWTSVDFGDGTHHYTAKIQMDEDRVLGDIFNFADGEPIARVTVKGETNTVIPTGLKEPDSCLFGTLTESWIGTSAEKAFIVRNLRRADCHLDGTEDVSGKKCHVASYAFKTYDAGYESEWVQQRIYIDSKTFLLLRWVSESRRGMEWDLGMRFMRVERSYMYKHKSDKEDKSHESTDQKKDGVLDDATHRGAHGDANGGTTAVRSRKSDR